MGVVVELAPSWAVPYLVSYSHGGGYCCSSGERLGCSKSNSRSRSRCRFYWCRCHSAIVWGPTRGEQNNAQGEREP